MYYIYFLASKKNGTIYTGMTVDLRKRIWQHKNAFVEGFTNKYKVTNLVYFEEYSDLNEARHREQRLKRWKIDLIEKCNPEWKDLYHDIFS